MRVAGAETTWLLGWQGLTVEVPLAWSLSKVEGTHESGYLRLDDELMPRLELRWGASPRKQKPIEELTEDYLRQAREFARKQKVSLEFAYVPKFFPARGREVIYLTLQSDYPSHIIVSRCKRCGRVMLARVLHQPKEDIAGIVGRIFGGLRDHPSEGKVCWSVFDLQMTVAETFRLKSSRFQVGRIALEFERGAESLAVERLNFAREILGSGTLRGWMGHSLRRVLRPFSWSAQDWKFRDEEGARIIGSLTVWRRIARLRLQGRCLNALGWRCGEADRLYLLYGIGAAERPDELERVAESIECHRPAE